MTTKHTKGKPKFDSPGGSYEPKSGDTLKLKPGLLVPDYKKQRDELLEACSGAMEYLKTKFQSIEPHELSEEIIKLESVIKKATE